MLHSGADARQMCEFVVSVRVRFWRACALREFSIATHEPLRTRTDFEIDGQSCTVASENRDEEVLQHRNQILDVMMTARGDSFVQTQFRLNGLVMCLCR